MKLRPPVATALGLLTIGAGALVVSGISSRQSLDAPGVRIGNVPLLVEEGRTPPGHSVSLPETVPGFTFERLPMAALELDTLPADTVFGRGRYLSGSNETSIQINVVVSGLDRTSIHRPEYCLTGIGWKIQNQRIVEAPIGRDASPLALHRFDCRSRTTINGVPTDAGGVFVFWFVSSNRRTASHWERQKWQIWDLITSGKLQRWAYISYFMPCMPGDEERAYHQILELIQATAPSIETPREG